MKNRALVRLAVELLKGFKAVVVLVVVKTDERKKPFDDLGDDDNGGGGEGDDDVEGGEVEVRSMDVRLALLTTTPTAKSRLIRKELPPLSGIVDRLLLLCAACLQ